MSVTPATLPALLTRAARAHGGRPAVVMDGRQVSYAELHDLAARVAATLRAHGVQRGDPVALWLPKSPEAIAALYGAMLAGAAYVPVDPGSPPARMAWIVRHAGAVALVTRTDRLAQIAQAFEGTLPVRSIVVTDIVTDDEARAQRGGVPVASWREVLSAPAEARLHVEPDDLSYILYTSGSTGEPKGVAHTHASAMAFVDWAARTFAVGSEDRLANHAPFHFDLSTFDLFAAAWAGAAVYPVSARIFSFPAAVAKSWSEQRLTIWYATPSSLTLMLTRGNLAALDLSALRVLLFAGEVFPVKYLRELMALAPRARFANLYGPTETNVCTWLDVTRVPAGDAPLPIGVPCCGDQAFVLDESLGVVPDGAPGELWIAGPTVMRGYWGDPERTVKSLRPLDAAGGARAYATGDLVRRRADGALEFLGRRDHQVKTRGYRVELGEIEVALHRHPAVDEAVVVAIPDDEITNRIVAIVVTRRGADATEAALKQHCAESLPRYMVPERISFRDALPRTSSGKVDRRALASVES
ncbi:MAG TPA: amino acid adenylation domain-containing protein [Candidatus Eisenbacteria bacterium]|nr:amino acid adenylation domain-containing protein [Candidatus Eisenbacteria bacterium]